jgi:HEAT repeat protein
MKAATHVLLLVGLALTLSGCSCRKSGAGDRSAVAEETADRQAASGPSDPGKSPTNAARPSGGVTSGAGATGAAPDGGAVATDGTPSEGLAEADDGFDRESSGPDKPVSAWISDLTEGSTAVKIEAIFALAAHLPTAPQTATAIDGAAKDSDADVRFWAEKARVASLIHALRQGGPGSRKAAAEALGKTDGGDDVVRALRQACRDADAEVRASAKLVLARIYEPAIRRLLAEYDEVRPDRSRYHNGGRSVSEIKRDLVAIGSPTVPALYEALKGNDATFAREILVEIDADAMPALIDEFKKDHWFKRRGQATKCVSWLGPAAKDAVPELIGALNDQDAAVRFDAAIALGKIDPTAKDTVPVLVDALKDRDTSVRRAAAEALDGIGPAAKDAVPALIDALKDQNASERFMAASVLVAIGPAAKDAVPALIDALRDERDREAYETPRGWYADIAQSRAANALGEIGAPAKDAVPALHDALKDQHASVRCAAVRALSRISPPDDAAVSALIRALEDQDEDVQRAATESIGRTGAGARDAVPPLEIAVRALRGTSNDQKKSESVRLAAAMSLIRIGNSDREAIRALHELCKSGKTHEIRGTALSGLIAARHVPALVALIRHGGEELRHSGAQGPALYWDASGFPWYGEELRRSAAEGLGKVGAPAVAALSALVKDATENRDARCYAAFALGNIGHVGKDAVPALINALKDQDANVRWSAAAALGKIGPAAEDAVPALSDALKDQNGSVRSSAAAALGTIGPAAKDTVLALNDAVNDKYTNATGALDAILRSTSVPELVTFLRGREYAGCRHLRAEAAEALGRIGPAARAAVPALIDALKDPEEPERHRDPEPSDRPAPVERAPARTVRDRAAEALGKIGPAAKDAVPALSRALNDPDKAVGTRAAEALGRIGPAAKAAVPALLTAFKDDKRRAVGDRAAEALGRMGPAAKTAVPVLSRALNDGSRRELAGRALVQIGQPAVPVLVDAYLGFDAELRRTAETHLLTILFSSNEPPEP